MSTVKERKTDAMNRRRVLSRAGSWASAALFLIGIAFGCLAMGARGVQAADYATYRGTIVGSAPIITAAPGETKTVELRLKNTGRAAWSNGGRSYVSAYTIQPRYHASPFRSADWNSSSQTPRLLETSVPPGATGTIRLTVTAPKIPGTYKDTLQAAAENTSWIWGAWTPLTVNVVGSAVTPSVTLTAAPQPVPMPPAPAAAAVEAAATPAQPAASLVYRSADRIEAPGGASMTMRVTYHNNGTAPWKKVGLHVVAFKAPPGGDEALDDSAWASSDIPVSVDRYVPGGQSTDLYFTFSTPRKQGEYRLTFDLIADGGELTDAPLELPIKVMSDATAVAPPETPSGSQVPPPTVTVGEPAVRVGLYTTATFETVSFNGAYAVRDANGASLASFASGAQTQFWYDLPAHLYRFTDGVTTAASALPIRFVPANAGEIFTLWSHDDTAAWNASVHYNQFRGVLELRKNDRNDYVWVINELPMEQYLKGMKETSAASPAEYQKAMAVAARSYANWHYAHPGKHWHFTVDATYDQVYKGYVAETQNPVLSAAVDATRGQVVTYAGEPVVTPYYSSSDGRTRAWTEVWGGTTKPWLVSVPAPFDAAAHRPLFGHGVGLSAWDSIDRANAGATYDTILRYYYTGTALTKLY